MKDTEILARLADIQGPPPPSPAPWLAAAITAAALVLLAGLALWRYHRRRTVSNPAGQRLEALRQAWRAGRVDDRQAAYQLAALLRLGLGLRQLTPASPPPAVDDSDAWRATLQILDQIRYRPPPRPSLSEQTFDRARAWLASEGEP